jgi:hypothetical protein
MYIDLPVLLGLAFYTLHGSSYTNQWGKNVRLLLCLR